MLKKCKDCNKNLPLEDYYFYQGNYRTNCKKCHSNKMVRRQSVTKPWKNRDPEQKRKDSKAYYKKNKEKFEEYRKKFAENHPLYYREYAKKRYQDKKAKKGLAK